MTPGRPPPIVIYQGDSWDYPFRINERLPDGSKGDPVPLDGCTVLSQIRQDNADRTLVVQLTATLADQVASPGLVMLSLTPTQTSDLTPASTARPNANNQYPLGTWDVQITWPSGEVRTYLKTQVLLELEISFP